MCVKVHLSVCVCVREPVSPGPDYLQQAALSGDHQDVGVAVVLGDGEQLLGRRGRAEQEGRAGAADIPRVGDVAELVELPVTLGNIVACESVQR